jgi:hypothetical protein
MRPTISTATRRTVKYNLNDFNADILEELLNRALARFVREVAGDPEIRAALTATRAGP